MSAEGQRFGRTVRVGESGVGDAGRAAKEVTLTPRPTQAEYVEVFQSSPELQRRFHRAVEIERVAREVVEEWDHYQGAGHLETIICRLRALVTP